MLLIDSFVSDKITRFLGTTDKKKSIQLVKKMIQLVSVEGTTETLHH